MFLTYTIAFCHAWPILLCFLLPLYHYYRANTHDKLRRISSLCLTISSALSQSSEDERRRATAVSSSSSSQATENVGNSCNARVWSPIVLDRLICSAL